MYSYGRQISRPFQDLSCFQDSSPLQNYTPKFFDPEEKKNKELVSQQLDAFGSGGSLTPVRPGLGGSGGGGLGGRCQPPLGDALQASAQFWRCHGGRDGWRADQRSMRLELKTLTGEQLGEEKLRKF